MNGWIIALFVIIFIDAIRYAKYLMAYSRLHRPEEHRPDHRDTNHDNIKKLLNDLKLQPNLLSDLINDAYYSKVKMDDMNFDDVCEVLFELIGSYPQYLDEIKSVVRNLQSIERKKNHIIFESNAKHNRMQVQRYKLKTWFPILPIYLATRGFGLIIKLYMLYLGYKYYTFKNGLKIWYNAYDKKKGVPLVFFHPSVGGVSLQFTVLNYLHTTHNIIMPEIPGVSFLDAMDRPAPISEIIDEVDTFITNHYIKNMDHSKLKINLMGHSLGCSICSAYINRYPKRIDNFFCIEGQIFFTRALRIYADFDEDVNNIPPGDLISVPLFHRELYVQYFMYKRLTIDFVCIFDRTEENKHINIHVYHIKGDKRILIDPQLKYAVSKNIHIKYHLFEGDYTHGAFVLRADVKQYIIDDIKKVYEEHKHFDYNILKD